MIKSYNKLTEEHKKFRRSLGLNGYTEKGVKFLYIVAGIIIITSILFFSVSTATNLKIWGFEL
tara:strand:+ start:272 stop:460 length:189 start_codon:yes stop_codon:yes gene_type:complete